MNTVAIEWKDHTAEGKHITDPDMYRTLAGNVDDPIAKACLNEVAATFDRLREKVGEEEVGRIIAENTPDRNGITLPADRSLIADLQVDDDKTIVWVTTDVGRDEEDRLREWMKGANGAVRVNAVWYDHYDDPAEYCWNVHFIAVEESKREAIGFEVTFD